MIKNFLVGLVNFVRGALSEPDGTPSTGRIMAVFALGCSMKWVHFMVYKHGEIPDLMNVLILVGGLYSISKVSGIFEAYINAKAGVQAQPVQTVTASTTVKTS